VFAFQIAPLHGIFKIQISCHLIANQIGRREITSACPIFQFVMVVALNPHTHTRVAPERRGCCFTPKDYNQLIQSPGPACTQMEGKRGRGWFICFRIMATGNSRIQDCISQLPCSSKKTLHWMFNAYYVFSFNNAREIHNDFTICFNVE